MEQVAVQEAIAVLKEYYTKSVEATVFSQQTPADDAPETFEKPYKGMFPEGGEPWPLELIRRRTLRILASLYCRDQNFRGRSFLLTGKSFLLTVGLCCLRSVGLVFSTYSLVCFAYGGD